MQSKVLILGSINVDITVRVTKLPMPGETVHGSDPVNLPGGKGGNQAVAVAGAGATAVMVGAVGEDEIGADALRSLTRRGVDISQVSIVSGTTGIASIYVEDSGENTIVVSPGANAHVTPENAELAISEIFANAHPLVLAQMELPLATVGHAAKLVNELGGRFILNLAPAIKPSDTLLAACDPIIVNEYEAQIVTGLMVESIEDAKKAALEICRTAKSSVVTLGGLGAVVAQGDTAHHYPAEQVNVVDTTGAGDAFVGALTASLAAGTDLSLAVEAGISAGAKAVQHFGAQPPLN